MLHPRYIDRRTPRPCRCIRRAVIVLHPVRSRKAGVVNRRFVCVDGVETYYFEKSSRPDADVSVRFLISFSDDLLRLSYSCNNLQSKNAFYLDDCHNRDRLLLKFLLQSLYFPTICVILNILDISMYFKSQKK